jgi:hypothetical protein
MSRISGEREAKRKQGCKVIDLTPLKKLPGKSEHPNIMNIRVC